LKRNRNNIPNNLTVDIIKNIKRNLTNGKSVIYESELSKDNYEYYSQLIDQYPIISIEDPMAEGDIEGWQEITAKLGDKIMLVGDDIFVTNTINLHKGIKNKIGNKSLST
jgi:enolase